MKHRSSSHLRESVATIPIVSEVIETEVVKVRERRVRTVKRIRFICLISSVAVRYRNALLGIRSGRLYSTSSAAMRDMTFDLPMNVAHFLIEGLLPRTSS